MAVKIVSGIPGSGKNVYCVYMAKKHYKQENSFFVISLRYFKYYVDCFKVLVYNLIHTKKKDKPKNFLKDMYHKKGRKFRINNVYSNFSILLDKKRNIYSNTISFWELDNRFSFLPYSLIIIDEIQSYIDSEEFKKFPKDIARFNQWHRHYGIKDIVYVSQHPSRVAKKIRNLTNEFLKINYFGQIPILKFFPILNKIGFFKGTMYYELEEYGKSTKIDKDYAQYDYKKIWFFCNIKDIWSRYTTLFFYPYNSHKPLLYDREFNKLSLTREEIEEQFPLY